MIEILIGWTLNNIQLNSYIYLKKTHEKSKVYWFNFSTIIVDSSIGTKLPAFQVIKCILHFNINSFILQPKDLVKLHDGVGEISVEWGVTGVRSEMICVFWQDFSSKNLTSDAAFWHFTHILDYILSIFFISKLFT